MSLKGIGLYQGNWQMLNSFDGFACDDYINCDNERFLKRNKIFRVKACLKTGRNHRKVYINCTTGNIVTDFLPKIPCFFI